MLTSHTIPNFTTQMSRRIVNTPYQRHYSGYVLIYYAFCGGVLKECEAPFSQSYIRLKNYLNLRSYMWLLVVCCRTRRLKAIP